MTVIRSGWSTSTGSQRWSQTNGFDRFSCSWTRIWLDKVNKNDKLRIGLSGHFFCLFKSSNWNFHWCFLIGRKQWQINIIVSHSIWKGVAEENQNKSIELHRASKLIQPNETEWIKEIEEPYVKEVCLQLIKYIFVWSMLSTQLFAIFDRNL